MGAFQASVIELVVGALDPDELFEPLPPLPPELLEPPFEAVEPEAVPLLPVPLLPLVPPLLLLLPEATVDPLLDPLLEPPELSEPDPSEVLMPGPVGFAPVLADGSAVGVAGVTMIDSGGSGTEVPSALAEMMMFVYWPASALLGTPESSPVMKLKLAQAGLCSMLYEEAAACGW